MTKNERTSLRIVKLAARIFAGELYSGNIVITFRSQRGSLFEVTGKDVRALAASCLTQAPDRRRVPTPAELADAIATADNIKAKRIRRLTLADNRDDKRRAHRTGSPFFPAAQPKRSSP